MKRSPISRGAKSLARGSTFATRATGLRTPRKPSKRLPGAKGWTGRVFALYGDRCVVCGGKATEAHHATPKHIVLAAMHLPRDVRVTLATDARQGVPICAFHHAQHEVAAERIPFEALPPGVIEWATFHGFRGRIMDRRVYPRSGA